MIIIVVYIILQAWLTFESASYIILSAQVNNSLDYIRKMENLICLYAMLYVLGKGEYKN